MNTRFLCSKVSEFIVLLSSLNSKFDAICVSETWLDSATENLIQLYNYNFVGANRPNARGEGVGVYIRDD